MPPFTDFECEDSSVKFFANPKQQEQADIVKKPRVEMTFDDIAPHRNIPTENYLMRWEGQIVPPTDGSYTLEIEGAPGDSSILWINGKQVLKDNTFGED